ncbi:MAG: ATP-binding cassette domain-containing protein [Oscillospiraceae bacterium]|nr:ATP-binding cassette domain-containing protein [Oscillospiraceae bacterium]MBQ9938692.1 ATP-binding cassette domain-containing protein [Oscillospiraceae bacterium]
MIEVKNLVKQYGNNFAVNDVSFEVKQGDILGFLGPNGAGKSTTMNIITGYLSATSGTATIDGIDILEDPMAAKAKIGYLPEHPPLYLDMTVKEYLGFVYELKKVSIPRTAHIDEICDLVKISDVYKRPIRNLSKGYKQRVGIAQALLGNPQVLILDEPTVGLDPKQIIEIRNLIRELGERHTVILSSHILPEVQAVCDRIIVINKGKLVADDTPDNLSKNLSSDHKLRVRVDGPERDVARLLEKIPGMLSVSKLGEREKGVYDFDIEAEPNSDLRREVFKRLAERQWPILGMKSTEMTLEDIFLQLTTDAAADAE